MVNKAISAGTASLILICVLIGLNCSDNSAVSSSVNNSNVPDVYKKIYGAKEMYLEGDYIVIKTSDLPEHKSPYYQGTQWADSMYEAYNGPNPNFQLAPNRIVSQSLTFKLPVNPSVDPNHKPTPLGPIGISLNGVVIFNQYAGNGAPLTNEINTFDQYNGHPQMSGVYHYHVEPLYILNKTSDSSIVGFLLDGFPVYGPKENGKTITNSDLDSYHGHFGVTEDYPNGIYHYHTTSEAPYINGDGFYGYQGTVTN